MLGPGGIPTGMVITPSFFPSCPEPGLNGRNLFGGCNDIIEQKDQLQIESTRVNQRGWGGKMISHINACDIPGKT